MLYTLDDSDKFEDPENWIKANPALGYVVREDYLQGEYNQGKNISSQLPNFLTKHLNIFVEGSDAWIPEEVLQRVNNSVDLEKFEGKPCCLGVDLSSTRI